MARKVIATDGRLPQDETDSPLGVNMDASADDGEGSEVSSCQDISSTNKKRDYHSGNTEHPGIFWRLTSGAYSTATGAVGAGVGGMRWAASKTYSAGLSVVSKVPVPLLRRKKDKNE